MVVLIQTGISFCSMTEAGFSDFPLPPSSSPLMFQLSNATFPSTSLIFKRDPLLLNPPSRTLISPKARTPAPRYPSPRTLHVFTSSAREKWTQAKVGRFGKKRKQEQKTQIKPPLLRTLLQPSPSPPPLPSPPFALPRYRTCRLSSTSFPSSFTILAASPTCLRSLISIT